VRLTASLSLCLLATACVEDIVAPGICPEFCPATQIEIVDSVFTVSIDRDSSFVGYLPTHQAATIQLTTGGVVESYGVIRYFPFDDEVSVDTASSDLRPVLAVDSFNLRIDFDARSSGTGEFEFVLFRLPVSVDSTTTYAELQSFFNDSTELTSVLVTGDAAADSIGVVIAGDAFPTLEEDSSVAAIGISIRSVEPAFVNLKTRDRSFQYLQIVRFVQVDSADGQPAARMDTTRTAFDTFVFPELPAAGPTALPVGGSPSSRTFMHVSLPSRVVDSSSVVRATLLLVPSEPVVGAPGDSIRILAEGLAADIGPKSPIKQVPADSIGAFSGLALVGSTDTLRIDVTHIIAPWRNDPSAARAMMLRAFREGGTLSEFRFNSSMSLVGAPTLHITFIPPAKIGN
jgi:hypothetical protein